MPLPDVEILGGSEDQRRAARRELLSFDQWVGPGRVEISEVRFSPDFDEITAGALRVPSMRVRLDEGLSSESVPWVLRHELCHALDFTEGLLDAPRDPFDDLGQHLSWLEAMNYGVEVEALGISDRDARSEAFATVCHTGPWVAELLASPCPEDPDDLEAFGAMLTQEVWIGVDIETVDASPNEAASWSPPEPFLAPLVVGPTVDPHVVQFDMGTPEAVQVDLYTAMTSDVPVDLADVSHDLADEPLVGVRFDAVVGNVDGPGAALADVEIPGVDRSEVRLYAWQGTAWARVRDTCGDADVFVADGRAWRGWYDDGQVHWTGVPPW